MIYLNVVEYLPAYGYGRALHLPPVSPRLSAHTAFSVFVLCQSLAIHISPFCDISAQTLCDTGTCMSSAIGVLSHFSLVYNLLVFYFSNAVAKPFTIVSHLEVILKRSLKLFYVPR